MKGTVKAWAGHHGWIARDEGTDLFIHESDLPPSIRASNLRVGANLEFDVVSEERGERAANVRVWFLGAAGNLDPVRGPFGLRERG